ncbi:hypothetical protein GCM10010124_27120 [Pilimelia terevasa]|uniref:NERD domain-containing protein n=1 Tax=Pilimelia terevasa TaxID=53372 RepID=A0A8J3FKE1_9ACTN|nr:hypothetical protein GCM10010124_27120 [Pilimelia terevasa]
MPTVQDRPATPIDWFRRHRARRDVRRTEAAGNRAADRLDELGPGWHVVDWPRTDDDPAVGEQAGFLVIGPGGVFAVTVVDHGRSTVLIAGDVVQINGRRPPHITRARRDAGAAARVLSRAVGVDVPVVAVLAFVGTGRISMHGLPRDCLLTSYRELDRLLLAGGDRISPRTAEKLAHVAGDPATWINRPYRSSDDDHHRDRQDRAATSAPEPSPY